jgi:hypothetical protein
MLTVLRPALVIAAAAALVQWLLSRRPAPSRCATAPAS